MRHRVRKCQISGFCCCYPKEISIWSPSSCNLRCKVGSPRCFLMLCFQRVFGVYFAASQNTGPRKKRDQKLRTILMLLTNKTHNVPSTSQRSKSCCYFFFFVFVAKLLFLFSMAANKTIISAAPKQFFSNFLDGMALSFRWRASSTEWHEKVYHYQDFECCVHIFLVFRVSREFSLSSNELLNNAQSRERRARPRGPETWL